MTLDEVFASQSGIAAAVKKELDVDMAGFGYEIVNVLVTDIVPDAKVKSAMNDINAAQREQVAANARGEAEKILVVKKAEAEAESKALQGQGIANQRKAIIEGLQGSIEQFQKVVGGASTSEVMQLVLVTQYFDTIKSIGESDKTNTLFLSHSPGAVKEISDQVLQSMVGADKAKALGALRRDFGSSCASAPAATAPRAPAVLLGGIAIGFSPISRAPVRARADRDRLLSPVPGVALAVAMDALGETARGPFPPASRGSNGLRSRCRASCSPVISCSGIGRSPTPPSRMPRLLANLAPVIVTFGAWFYLREQITARFVLPEWRLRWAAPRC